MTLTELSYYTRKYYPLGILCVLVVFIMFYSVQLVILLTQNKQRGPYINPVFHALTPPTVPEASTSAGMKFVLDNVEGAPVTATEAARVYFLKPPPDPQFGYREKAYLIAKTLGFDTTVDNSSNKGVANFQLQGGTAVFNDPKQKLEVDIRNFNFKYQYKFADQPNYFSTVIPPNQQEAQNRATSFLQKIDVYPQELSTGKTNTIVFIFNPDTKTIRPANKDEDGNLIEVDFLREEIDGYPIVSSTFFNSQNFVLMAFLTDGSVQILRAQIQHFAKSTEQYGIYPIRTGDEAFSDLKNGNSIVVSNPQRVQNARIRKMFMGYYDPISYQNYLQPVYVFLGDDNFVAYVPAVTKQYMAADAKTTPAK